jgi:hypothetical protein
VTFLSLPGLDNIARVAGFVAILFSSFSMASTVVAIFKYKADLERPTAHVGGEGLIMLSVSLFADSTYGLSLISKCSGEMLSCPSLSSFSYMRSLALSLG